ncbi:hypothetical protein TTHERM_000926899, partial (macronuclear) [Tetrahymena thermophila SB210]
KLRYQSKIFYLINNSNNLSIYKQINQKISLFLEDFLEPKLVTQFLRQTFLINKLFKQTINLFIKINQYLKNSFILDINYNFTQVSKIVKLKLFILINIKFLIKLLKKCLLINNFIFEKIQNIILFLQLKRKHAQIIDFNEY